MSEFLFNPDSIVPAAQYEFVNIIKNAPKNPKDFHDIENLLRYKTVAFFKEIIGNCRTSATSFSTYTDGPDKYVNATGVWYIDGYRLSMSNVLSEQVLDAGDSFNIYVALKFDEIDYSEHAESFPDDPIALQDPSTKQFIPTSTRIKLAPVLQIIVENEGEPTLPTGYSFQYLLGTATWDSDNSIWTYADATGFTYISTKYNEALAIVQSALHLESDDKTAIIKRITTADETASAYAYMEEVNSEKVRMGFADVDGNTFAAFEMIYQDGDWQPILWMKNGTAEYPVSFMSPSGFEVFDNKGNGNKIKQASINLGNDVNKFIVDTTELLMLFNNAQVALWVKNGLVGYELKTIPTTPIAPYTATSPKDPTTYNNCMILASDIDDSGNGKVATYRFDLGASASSSVIDGLVKIRHQLAYDSAASGTGLITAKVEVSDSESSGYIVAFFEKYLLKSGNITNTTPIEFSIKKTADNNAFQVYRYVQVTYTIEPFSQSTTDVTGSVAMHAGAPMSWVYYSASYPVVQTPNLLIGNTTPNFTSPSYHIFWIDEDGNARIKKVDNSNQDTLGIALEAMKTNAGGNNITDAGGKIIGDSSLIDENSTEISNVASYDKPTYDNVNRKLVFPLVNNNTDSSAVSGGLISSAQYKSILDSINGTSAGSGVYTNANTVYVSPAWQNKPSSGPFFETIQAAVNYLLASGAQLSGLVIVYPGVYTGGLTFVHNDIDTGNIAIVALDPKNTYISGKVICDSSARYRNAYIDIPIVQTSNDYAVHITNASSNITFGRNATITSSVVASAVKIDQGVVDIYSDVWHTTEDGVSPTFDIGSGTNAPTVNMYGNINNFSYSETAGNLGGSITVKRGIVHVYGIIRNDAIETSTSQFLVSIAGNGTCEFHAHNDIIAKKGMGLLKSAISGGSSVSYLHGKLYKNDALIGVSSNAILINDGTVNIYSPFFEITGSTNGHAVRNYSVCNIHNSYVARTGSLPLFKTASNYLNLYNCVLKNGTGTGDIIVNDTTGGFTSINCVTNCAANAYTGTKQTGLSEII